MSIARRILEMHGAGSHRLVTEHPPPGKLRGEDQGLQEAFPGPLCRGAVLPSARGGKNESLPIDSAAGRNEKQDLQSAQCRRGVNRAIECPLTQSKLRGATLTLSSY